MLTSLLKLLSLLLSVLVELIYSPPKIFNVLHLS